MLYFITKKPLFFIALVVLLLVLPVTVFLLQQRSETRSNAEKTVTLSFSPSSSSTTPYQAYAGDNFSLDIMLNPGTNLVSQAKVEFLYDPAKLEIARGLPFNYNQSAFPQLVEGPVFTPGKVSFTLSIGLDPSRAIKTATRIATITFRALPGVTTTEGPTLVTFSPDSQILSISSASTGENVLASTIPAYISISDSGQVVVIPSPPVIPSTPPAPQVCADKSAGDIMLVMDQSGSMNDKVSGPGPKGGPKDSKLQYAKTAANQFVDIVSSDTRNKLGLVRFNYKSVLNVPLTTDYTTLKNQILGLSATGSTCIECGIIAASQEISAHGRAGYKKAVVLLTDGRANTVLGGPNKNGDTAIAEIHAMTATLADYNVNKTVYYTIGLGNDVNGIFLKLMAESTGGRYYYSPSATDLGTIYSQISQVVTRGSVVGYVYNDVNKNGVFDTDEPKLSGWTLQLYSGTSSTPIQTVQTDASGAFNIAGLCDGTYTLKEIVQPGWVQSAPPGGSYTFSIVNGSAYADKSFGNYVQTVNACVQAPSDMVGWWPGDGNANDIQGSNTGTVRGATYTFGKVQQGFNLNGTSDYVSLGKGPAIVGKGAFSVDSWIRTTDSNGVIIQQRELTPGSTPSTPPVPGCTPAGCNGEYILSVGGLSGGGADPNGVPGFVQDPGKICWATFGDGYYGFNFCSNRAVNDGQFHHIVGVREVDGTGKIYIDGVLDKSQSSPSRTLAQYEVVIGADKRSTDEIAIAWPGVGDGYYLSGVVDEVEIFNRGLSASEAQNLYAAGSYGKCKPAPVPTSTPVPTSIPTATATSAPNATTFSLEVLLHGIGSSGDNANPTANSLSNKNPLHPVQQAVLSLFDTNNNLVGSVSGNVTYDSGSGSYKGQLALASPITAGFYTVKVRTSQHLTKLVPGIQSISANGTNTIQAVHLITGDANNDNKLDILDYNMMLDCYSDLSPAPACDPNKKLLTDFNDDGNVNQFDYNLFIREISTQPGN